jgi:hypothetical protein
MITGQASTCDGLTSRALPCRCQQCRHLAGCPGHLLTRIQSQHGAGRPAVGVAGAGHLDAKPDVTVVRGGQPQVMLQGLIGFLARPATPAGSQLLKESHQVIKPSGIVRLHPQSRGQAGRSHAHLDRPHSAIRAVPQLRETQAILLCPDEYFIHPSNAGAARSTALAVSTGVYVSTGPVPASGGGFGPSWL